MNKIYKSLVVSMGQLRLAHRIRPTLLAIGNRSPTSVFTVHPVMSNLTLGARLYMKQNNNFKYESNPDRPKKPWSGMRRSNGEEIKDDQYDDAEPVEAVHHEVSFADNTLKGGFAEFELPQELLVKLDELGFKTPFEIQAATLKHTLAGK